MQDTSSLTSGRPFKQELSLEADITGTGLPMKRIKRIMKKYGIVCTFRKPNPYKRMMKATQEHRGVPNLLNKEFKQNISGKVLLTDSHNLTKL